MYVETINIAWGAIPLFWFNQMDGRGPWDLGGSIRENKDSRQVWRMVLLRMAYIGDAVGRDLEKLVVDLAEALESTNTTLSDYLSFAHKKQQVIDKIIPALLKQDLKVELFWLLYLINEEKIRLKKLKGVIHQVLSKITPSRDRYETMLKIQDSLIPDYLDEDVNQWIVEFGLKIYENSSQVLRSLLIKIAEENDPRCLALSDSLLEALIYEKNIHKIGTLSDDIPLERWKLAKLMVTKTREFLARSESPIRRGEASIEDLKYLKELFAWETDPEDADMLVAILFTLCERLNPNWKTPRAILVEVLIKSGRVDAARRISEGDPDIYIFHHGQRYNVDTFIRMIEPPKRDKTVSSDYLSIAEQLL